MTWAKAVQKCVDNGLDVHIVKTDGSEKVIPAAHVVSVGEKPDEDGQCFLRIKVYPPLDLYLFYEDDIDCVYGESVPAPEPEGPCPIYIPHKAADGGESDPAAGISPSKDESPAKADHDPLVRIWPVTGAEEVQRLHALVKGMERLRGVYDASLEVCLRTGETVYIEYQAFNCWTVSLVAESDEGRSIHSVVDARFDIRDLMSAVFTDDNEDELEFCLGDIYSVDYSERIWDTFDNEGDEE